MQNCTGGYKGNDVVPDEEFNCSANNFIRRSNKVVFGKTNLFEVVNLSTVSFTSQIEQFVKP